MFTTFVNIRTFLVVVPSSPSPPLRSSPHFSACPSSYGQRTWQGLMPSPGRPPQLPGRLLRLSRWVSRASAAGPSHFGAGPCANTSATSARLQRHFVLRLQRGGSAINDPGGVEALTCGVPGIHAPARPRTSFGSKSQAASCRTLLRSRRPATECWLMQPAARSGGIAP
jgi:hypothetical protein